MFLAEISLCTNDVPKLADFYRTLLRLTEENQDEVHQVILQEPLTLTIYNDGVVKNNQNQNICLAFTVDSVDEEYERLKSIGITILEPPTTRPWGARNMHFCDPDGNHIYLRSFPK
jgi:predicted enzyme related to lactoylglutathione lyase